MIMTRKEKELMKVIYEAASERGQCLISPMEILSKIPYKVDFRESDIDKVMEQLKIDGYFGYDKARQKDEIIYCIVLKEKGLSFERDRKTARKKLIMRIATTIAFALLGYLIKIIITAVIG